MTNLDELIQQSKWKEFLLALPIDKPRGFAFPSVSAMDSCKSVAYRMNAQQESGRVFKTSLDYKNKVFTITASLWSGQRNTL